MRNDPDSCVLATGFDGVMENQPNAGEENESRNSCKSFPLNL